ncbi:MAG: energy transducer TonB [Pseudomonadota bacterium]
MATRTAERRPLGAFGRMGVVAAIHAALLVSIMHGFKLMPPLVIPLMNGEIIDDRQPPPPDRPPEKFVPEQASSVTLPLPELPPLPADDPAETIAATLVPIDKIPERTGTAVVEPQISGARLDPRRPLSQPDYPAQLIRENAQGSVDVEIFVQPDGRVGDARILKSSGYEAFDRNTLDEAKRRWRLVPATRDGVPVPQWYRLRVVFKLKNQ